MCNCCYFTLQDNFRSKNVLRKSDIRFYITILRPIVLLYILLKLGQCQKLRKIVLFIWARKILRRLYLGIQVDGTWQIRTNVKLYNLYGEQDIVILLSKEESMAGHVQ